MKKQNEKVIRCTKCNSDNVVKSKKPSSIVGVILLLLGIPLPIFKREYHCFECGIDFKVAGRFRGLVSARRFFME